METFLFGQRNWRIAVPLVAVAVVLIFFLLPISPIKNISLGNRLVISESGLLGFIGEENVIKYKGMHVNLSEDKKHLVFTWPELKKAEFYHVYLIDNSERQRITPVLGITENRFMYQADNIRTNTQYQWEIAGKLIDGRSFKARSSFIRKK